MSVTVIALIVFWTACILLLYVLFGYPLLLWLMARHSAKPVRKANQVLTVSIVLPVHNGQEHIRRKLESIARLDYPKDALQVLAISDGSTDRTNEIVREFRHEGIELIEIPRAGKAKALSSGIERCRGEIIVFTDVRQYLDPQSLTHMVACFADPDVGVVGADVIIKPSPRQSEATVGLYWRYEKWIRENLSRIDSTLGATGCLYAVRRELAVPVPAGILLDDVYQPLASFFRGYRIVMDDKAQAIDLPTSLKTEFSRKVRTLTGNWQILFLYPELLSSSNRMRFHFVSHKLGRLFLPYLMIAIGIASFWLPGLLGKVALLVQGTFYGIALIDLIIPERSGLKRLTSLLRTFVTLTAAAFIAPFALLFPWKNMWKPTSVAVVKQPS